MNITRREAMGLSALVAAPLASCVQANDASVPEEPQAKDPVRVRLLSTSDSHGRMTPWNYALNEEDAKGSMAQVATAVSELRDENSIVIDAGDIIQGNYADLFLAESPHPMILAMNTIGYDIGVLGNHEFNFGMDVLQQVVDDFAGTVITANIYKPAGERLVAPYTVVERGGVKIGLIGAVTPLIAMWDSDVLEEYTVTDPIEEARTAIAELEGQVDALVAVVHMAIGQELEVEHTSARELAEACPELDAIICGHFHNLMDETVNGVLIVQNEAFGRAVSCIDLSFERDGEHWKRTGRTLTQHEMEGVEPSSEIADLMQPYHERVLAYAQAPIGELVGGPLAPDDEPGLLPVTMLQDTALVDLMQKASLHYGGGEVSAASTLSIRANIQEGEILRYQVSQIYKYDNTLYCYRLTGEELHKIMERGVQAYRQYQPGDLTLVLEEGRHLYDITLFQGVNYEVDVSQPAGSRIKNLTWTSGTPVKPGDETIFVCNDYFSHTIIERDGEVFSKAERPELLESDVNSGLGTVREMIALYIEDVCEGRITSECDGNWRIVGTSWDEALHERALAALAATQELPEPFSYVELPSEPVTEATLAEAEAHASNV